MNIKLGNKAFWHSKNWVIVLGWSVDTRQSLLRGGEEADGINSNIGELLKEKAASGVKQDLVLDVFRICILEIDCSFQLCPKCFSY